MTTAALDCCSTTLRILARNEAVSGFDIPNNFQIGGLYELPFGKGKTYFQHGVGKPCPGRMASQWHIQRLLRSSFYGDGIGRFAECSEQYARLPIRFCLPLRCWAELEPGIPYYDPNAYAPVTAVRFGTSGRNTLRAPANFQCQRQPVSHISHQ